MKLTKECIVPQRCLEPWILVDYLLHREIIQLVCERDAPGRVRRARGQIVNEQAVIGINIRLSDGSVPNPRCQRASRTRQTPRR